MRSRLHWLLGCSLALSLVGCPDKQRREPAPAGQAADAGPVAPVDAQLALQVTAELPDGGTQPVAAEDSESEAAFIEPAQALVVATNVPVSNYRIRVLDESERAVVSDDTAESAPDGTLRYRIQFPEPLVAGSRYTLVMDPQVGAAIQGPQGRTFEELRLVFQTTGEKPKPQPPPKPSRRRRR